MRPSKNPRRLRPLAVALAVALVAAACGSDTGRDGNVAASGERKGGSVVFAAEQWPECLSPITSCANASWLPFTAWEHVMPRLMEVDPKGNYVASDLLVEAPTEQNGGIKADPFTITYKLRPEAVWDDGTPITSHDIRFTWEAIMKTTGTITTTGYDQIKTIDTSNPKTAVLTFKAPYAAWADLFGSTSINGVVLKKAAFGGEADLKDELQTSYGFSGGPWKLERYSQQQLVLVRNGAYWVKDKVPNLDQVTFVPRTDQTTEINSLLTGETLAAYPQPTRGMTRQLKAPGVKYVADAGNTFEGLWMNLDRFPFNELTARQAFAYAMDRQAVIDAIYKPDFPETQVLNCAGWVPTVGDWCDNRAFADISYQPDKVESLLEGSGWTRGGDGIYAKGGRRFSVEFNTTAGNTVREDTQALLKEKAKAAGIELMIKNFPPTQLFQDKLPKRDFTLAEYAQVASPDPSVTAILAGDQIPSAANGHSGQNFPGWNNPEATALMRQSDKTIDHGARRELIQRINQLERQDLAWLPLLQKPLILAWRDDRLTGPIGDYTATSYSGFFNMYDWSLK